MTFMTLFKLFLFPAVFYSIFCLGNIPERNASPNYSADFIRSKVEITGHGFFDYLRRLGISEDEVLKSKKQKWLSVGEGNSNFTLSAWERGIDAWAVDAVIKNPHAPSRSKIGLVQALPFNNQEFDRVISVWLINYFFSPEHFNDPVNGKKAILEMLRVTKIGGDIRINPVGQQSVITVLEDLKQQNQISYEILPYFEGKFKTENRKRIFVLEPVKENTPGSIKITRLK